MYSIPAGTSRSVSAGAGETLTVSAEDGRVWQLSDTGEAATLLMNLAGGEVQVLGPFDAPAAFRLDALRGPLTYSNNRPRSFEAGLKRATDVITAAADVVATINRQREPATMTTPTTPTKGARIITFAAIPTALDKLTESINVRGQRVLDRIEATDARGAAVEAKAFAYLDATDAALDAHAARFEIVEAAIGDNAPPLDGSPK